MVQQVNRCPKVSHIFGLGSPGSLSHLPLSASTFGVIRPLGQMLHIAVASWTLLRLSSSSQCTSGASSLDLNALSSFFTPLSTAARHCMWDFLMIYVPVIPTLLIEWQV